MGHISPMLLLNVLLNMHYITYMYKKINIKLYIPVKCNAPMNGFIARDMV